MNEQEYIDEAKKAGAAFGAALAEVILVGCFEKIKKEAAGIIPPETNRKRPMTENQRRYLSVNGIVVGPGWGFDEADAAIDKHKRGGGARY